MLDLVLRFTFGGAIVTLFAALAEAIHPKTLAGVFGAAPSVALVTLGIAHFQHGGVYVANEGRSMLVGGVGLIVYAVTATKLIRREHVPVWIISAALWCEWGVLVFGIWVLVLRA